MSTLDEMRKEAARIMALPSPTPEDYGRIHALLERRAREWRAPLERKLAAIRAGK